MTTRPTLALITTGGTIAGAAASKTDTTGYVAGSLGAAALLAAVPELGDVAELQAEELFALDSKDMTPAHWLALAHRVRARLDDPAIAGVVVTHGTDTLEESAYFLDRVLAGDKPVVLTGAMRPATALSADGPMNLYEAVRVAADPASAGRGVLVAFAGTILPAASARKQRGELAAFAGDACGRIEAATTVRYFAPPVPRRPAVALPATLAELPRVDLLYVAAGSAPDLLDAAVGAGACGIVLVLPGNGSLPDYWEEAVVRTAAAGVAVVRASRCVGGTVSARSVDERLGTRPAGRLTPAAARIELMLELAAGAPQS